MAVTIYHNPRCSKSRECLHILTEKGVSLEIIEYMKTPLTAGEIKAISVKLGHPPRDFIRKKEQIFKDLGLAEKLGNDAVLFAAMADNPKLIERAIVVKGDRAVLCRPPEKVLEIL